MVRDLVRVLVQLIINSASSHTHPEMGWSATASLKLCFSLTTPSLRPLFTHRTNFADASWVRVQLRSDLFVCLENYICGENSRMAIKTLNKRGLKLLQLIYENDYLTFEDIVLFLGSKGRASEYLSYLKKMNLIKEFNTNLKPRKAYYLTSWGCDFLQGDFKRSDKKFTISDYNFTKFPHQNMCTKIGIILEKHPLVKDFRMQKVAIYLEKQQGKEVFTKGWKQFDAEMVVEKDGKEYIVGVEIELTQKSAESYAKRFLNIETTRPDVFAVAWFCSNKTIITKMLEILKNMQMKVNTLRHKFCLIESFLKDWFKAEWMDVEGSLYLLPEITMEQENETENLN